MKQSHLSSSKRFFSGVLAVAVAATIGSFGLSSLGFETRGHGADSQDSQISSASKKQLLETSRAFNEIAKKAMPTVVSISVVKRYDPSEEEALLPGMGPLGPGDPHSGPPIGIIPDPSGSNRSVGIGSGVIIRKDGLILTNYHVVENSERITVTLDEKHKRGAKVVGLDPKTDLAVIKLDPPKTGEFPQGELPILEFGNSDEIAVGDWAVAVGSPFGLNRSVTSGIVSAKGRAQMGILDIEDFIQTDAAINPGSSGGPLLDTNGKMIGLNTAIFSQGGGFVGIGFAIPSKIVKEVADQLVAQGKVSRGWIGLSAQDLDVELAHYFKAPQNSKGEPQGALISDVIADGPAKKAAIQPGDVILKYDNQDVGGAGQFKNLVGKTQAGKNVKLEVLRSGKRQVRDVLIAQQPVEEMPTVQQAGQVPDEDAPAFGLAVEDVPSEISRFLEMTGNSGALVIGVTPGSPAFDSGLMPGDIILKAGHTEIRGAKQFKKVAKDISKDRKKEDLTVLYVQRGPQEKVFVPIKNQS